MDVKNEIFWSEIRSRFGELCGTPPPRIFRSNPLRPAPGTAPQIALKLISKNKKSTSDKYIYLFIYLFNRSPLPYKHLRYPCAKHAVIFRSQDRHTINTFY